MFGVRWLSMFQFGLKKPGYEHLDEMFKKLIEREELRDPNEQVYVGNHHQLFPSGATFPHFITKNTTNQHFDFAERILEAINSGTPVCCDMNLDMLLQKGPNVNFGIESDDKGSDDIQFNACHTNFASTIINAKCKMNTKNLHAKGNKVDAIQERQQALVTALSSGHPVT
jgi:hypothetical protein